MALDPRRDRIRRNMKRMWLLSAATAASPPPPTPEYDPNNLFEGGTYKGFWLNAAATSTLFTDAAGSVPVTADGDRVGYWADNATGQTSGSAWVRHTDDTYRPTYKVVGGYPCVRFDGSTDTKQGLIANTAGDDWLPGTGDFTAVLIIVRLGAAAVSTQYYMEFYDSSYSKGIAWQDWGAGSLRHVEQNLYIPATMSDVNVFTVRHVIDNTTPSYKWRLNGADDTSGGAATTTAFAAGSPPGHKKIGGTASGSVPYFDCYQVFFINKYLNDTEVAELEVNLASLAGKTI